MRSSGIPSRYSPWVELFLNLPNLGESDKIGHDPASRLATCGQVIEIHKTYCKYNAILWELSDYQIHPNWGFEKYFYPWGIPWGISRQGTEP